MKIFFLLFLTLFIIRSDGFSQAPVISYVSPSAGAPGDYIQIHGQYLTNVSAASFGGVAATLIFPVSDTMMYAQIGAGASGTITVTNASGTASFPGFVVYQNITINSFSPSSAGHGDTVVINGTHFLGAYQAYFGDSAASGLRVVSDNIINAAVGNGQSGAVFIASPYYSAQLAGFVYTGTTVRSFSPTSGVTGDHILISGQGFTGTTVVKFGGTDAASYTVVSDTVIDAIVGAGSPGDVLVASPFGTAAAKGFISPTATVLNPSSGHPDDVIAISGRNFTGVTGVNFGSTPAASFTIDSDTLLHATVGTGLSGGVKVIKGTLSSTGAFFTFLPYAPQVTSFTPTSGPTGATITIRGKYFTNASFIYFGTFRATSFTVVSDTLIRAVVGNGSTGSVAVQANGLVGSLPGFNYLAQAYPYIDSIYPLSAPAGTVITIHGFYFGLTPSANAVYFGTAKGTVVSASFDSLRVIVPGGACYGPVTVRARGMICVSSSYFDLLFAGSRPVLGADFFDAPRRFPIAYNNNPHAMVFADFDGDGKPDIAVSCLNFTVSGNKISIYKNNSPRGFISLATPFDLVAGNPSTATGIDITIADIDGDGKPDIISSCNTDRIFSVFRNTSTLGNISFAARVDFATGDPGEFYTSVSSVCSGDFDGDGKPDVGWVNTGSGYSCTVNWMRNITTGTTISFSPKGVAYVTSASSVFAADLNNDRQTDLAMAIDNSGSDNEVGLLRNISTAGTVSFQGNTSYGSTLSSHSCRGIVFGDLDKDGKTDLIANSAFFESILRNTGPNVNGGIVFENGPDINTILNAHSAFEGVPAIGDIDGDGKPDVIFGFIDSNKVAVMRNQSSPGAVTLMPRVTYPAGKKPGKVVVADIDNDGKPDMIVLNNDSSFNILRNRVGEPALLCPSSANYAINADATGITYQWQISTDGAANFTNLSDGGYYSGTTTALLQLTGIPSSFNGYIYRCLVNGTAGNNFGVQFRNTWTGAVNNLWSVPGNWSCGVIPDANTDVMISSGTVNVDINTSCRSVAVLPGAVLQVNSGVVFTVIH